MLCIVDGTGASLKRGVYCRVLSLHQLLPFLEFLPYFTYLSLFYYVYSSQTKMNVNEHDLFQNSSKQFSLGGSLLS